MTKCTTHHHACDCREAKFKELEQQLAEREQTIYLLSKQQDMVQQQNKVLREILSQAHDAFVCASDGHGVNFHAYAQDIKEALEGESDE